MRVCQQLVQRSLLAVLLITACRKADPPAPSGPVTQEEVNDWILAQMQEYYYWSATLPAVSNGRQEAADFFRSLLHGGDRYSVIVNAADRSSYPRDMLRTYGFGYYITSWPQAPGGAIGIVNFVMPGTAAAQNGLQRGDYFTHVNGQLLTPENAASLGGQLLGAASGSITRAQVSATGAVTAGAVFSLQARSLVENPLYKKEIWDVGGKKIAYLFLNNFDDYYNTDIVQAFTAFHQAGVQELILDLRYNPGGSVTGAALLSALIAPGLSANKPFIRFRGNVRQGEQLRSFTEILSVPADGNRVIPFNALTPFCLSLPRVFILTTGVTASSAELMVNNLQPYLQVVHIGQTTHGKDVGAVHISDERQPRRVPWELYPVTFKLANALGAGNYADGIAPQYVVDEKSRLPLLPVGHRDDPLIARALAVITGGGRQLPDAPSGVRVLYDPRLRNSDTNTIILRYAN